MHNKKPFSFIYGILTCLMSMSVKFYHCITDATTLHWYVNLVILKCYCKILCENSPNFHIIENGLINYIIV